MAKTIFLAAAASLIVAATAMSAAPTPAEARSGCEARADAIYPFDRQARNAYSKACK